MAGNEAKRLHPGAAVVAVAALVTVAYVATRPDEGEGLSPRVAGWHGAMELYRSLAMWAGKRALAAEMNYWKAVN